jgi:putative heme-binding domain-containing protein
MKRPLFAGAVAALALAWSSVIAQSPKTTPQPRAAAPQAAGEGATLFAMTCRVCHGDTGIGAVAPALRGAKFTARYVTEVMQAGRPGTMMPAFQGRFTPPQITGIARYVASLQQPAGESGGYTLHGDPAAGERLFFGSAFYSCHRCHAFGGRGGSVGPDLAARVASLAPREVFQRIVVVPHRRTDPKYVTVQIRTTGGLLMDGIKAGETADVVNFYDTATLPPVLRVIKKSEIIETNVRSRASVMPQDYAMRLSLQQLLDIVTFLKSTSAPAAITLTDLITVN